MLPPDLIEGIKAFINKSAREEFQIALEGFLCVDRSRVASELVDNQLPSELIDGIKTVLKKTSREGFQIALDALLEESPSTRGCRSDRRSPTRTTTNGRRRASDFGTTSPITKNGRHQSKQGGSVRRCYIPASSRRPGGILEGLLKRSCRLSNLPASIHGRCGPSENYQQFAWWSVLVAF
jgi:hypothetical protein